MSSHKGTGNNMGMFNRGINEGGWDGDDLAGFPEPTFWSKWFGGIIIPVLAFVYGAHDCIEKQAVLIIVQRYGGSSRTELIGDEAVALGLAWISAACFLHVHYYWTASPRLAVLSHLGKIISVLGIIGSLSYLFGSIISGWI